MWAPSFTPSIPFSYSLGDTSIRRWIMSSPHRTQATPRLRRATQARSHLRVILRRWTWRSQVTTLPDRWGLRVLILAPDSLLTKDTPGNRSTVGRGGPLLGRCMGNLPKTQVRVDTQQRAMQISANRIHRGNRWPGCNSREAQQVENSMFVFGGHLTWTKNKAEPGRPLWVFE